MVMINKCVPTDANILVPKPSDRLANILYILAGCSYNQVS